jgi:elongation factor G
MGELHLDIIVDRLKREFSVEATVGKPQVAYKETLTRPADWRRAVNQADGRPRSVWPRQRSICFRASRAAATSSKTKSSADRFPGIHQADRRRHQGSLTRGILAGFPIDDVRIELYDGSYHDVDSSEMAFKIAGSMAFQDAAKRADRVARTDDARRGRRPEGTHGRCHGQSQQPSRPDSIAGRPGRHADHQARVPLSEMFGYATDLQIAHAGPRDIDAFRPVLTGAAVHERRSRWRGTRAK